MTMNRTCCRCNNPAYTQDPGAELCRTHLSEVQKGQAEMPYFLNDHGALEWTDEVPAGAIVVEPAATPAMPADAGATKPKES